MKYNYFFILIGALSLTQINNDSKLNLKSFSNTRFPASEEKVANEKPNDQQINCIDKNDKTKIEPEVKKSLEDKIEVVKKLAEVEQPAEKKPKIKDGEDEQPSEKKSKKKKELSSKDKDSDSGNINVAELLMNMTNMMMTQQQIQMQFQMQMFSMMNSQNMYGMNSFNSNLNPYSFSYSQSPFQSPYQSFFPGYSSYNLLDSLGQLSYGIGIPSNGLSMNSGIYSFPSGIRLGGYNNIISNQDQVISQNSISAQRQPMSENFMPTSDQKFEVRMFDFNQNSSVPLQQPALNQMQRINM